MGALALGDVRMNEPALFSSDWHRAATLAPRLAPDVTIQRHVYRGRVAWMVSRPTAAQHFRLSQASYELVAELDGTLTVAALWQRVLHARDEQAPSQDELLELLGDLHDAQLLVVDRRLDVGRLFDRQRTERRTRQRARFLNPLYLRFALGDPDAWLERVAPIAAPLFSRRAFGLLCGLLAIAALALLTQAGRLVSDVAAIDPFDARHALLLLVLWPCLKLVHEAAHALAVKCRGGEVHEVGIAMMVLLPLPYVDASASGAFRERRDRMVVAAAGMLTEGAIAALAACVWAVAAGSVADVTLAVMLLAGVSTVLFNGNPLLRFDGYFLLSDWLEIPNLAERSQRYVAAAVREVFTGRPLSDTAIGREPSDAAERRWMLGYGIVAGAYRTLLMLSIAWMLSQRWPIVGLALAAWALYGALVRPALHAARLLLRDPVWSSARARMTAIGLPALLLFAFLTLPLPHATVTDGLVWLPDDALVRVDVDCEVVSVGALPREDVVAGEPLFECDDSALDLRVSEARATLDQLQVERAGLMLDEPVARARLDRATLAGQRELNDAVSRRASRRVIARRDGRFDTVGTAALAGRYLAPGDIAGYVIDVRQRTVRVALSEADAARLAEDAQRVSLHVGGAAGRAVPVESHIARRHHAATRTVVSAGLTRAGGGALEVVAGGDARQVVEPVFELELDWPLDAGNARIGSRVTVRFAHAPIPLARRLVDGMRRALMQRDHALRDARGAA